MLHHTGQAKQTVEICNLGSRLLHKNRKVDFQTCAYAAAGTTVVLHVLQVRELNGVIGQVSV